MPAEPLQLGVPKRLHAEADAIDAGRAKPVHPFGVDGLGVGLERDLGVRASRSKVVAAGLDQPANFRRLEQRRRAAAEEDGVDGLAPSAPARISRSSAAT